MGVPRKRIIVFGGLLGSPLLGKLPACSGFRNSRVTACYSYGDGMEVLKVIVGDMFQKLL